MVFCGRSDQDTKQKEAKRLVDLLANVWCHLTRGRSGTNKCHSQNGSTLVHPGSSTAHHTTHKSTSYYTTRRKEHATTATPFFDKQTIVWQQSQQQSTTTSNHPRNGSNGSLFHAQFKFCYNTPPTSAYPKATVEETTTKFST